MEDYGDIVSANMIHLLQAHCGELFAVEFYAAGGNIAVGIQKLNDAHGRNALARTRLADYAHGLARLEIV